MFVTSNVSDGLLSPFQEKVSKEENRANPPHLRATPRFESTIRPEMEFTTFTHYLFSTFLWTPCRPETFSLDSAFTAHPEPPPISTRYARHSLILRSARQLSWLDNLSICLWVPGIQTPSLAFGFTGLIKFVPNYYLSICIWVSGKQRSNHACVYNLCIRVYPFQQWLSQKKSVKTFFKKSPSPPRYFGGDSRNNSDILKKF